MEASVTLKMTPEEFDLLRKMGAVFCGKRRDEANDTQSTAGSRSAARVEFEKGQALMKKLGFVEV